MNLIVLMKINQEPVQKKFLRENSYWYKYLNRSNIYYKDFINEMKRAYKMTTNDKINKAIDNINMISSLLDVLK